MYFFDGCMIGRLAASGRFLRFLSWLVLVVINVATFSSQHAQRGPVVALDAVVVFCSIVLRLRRTR